MPAVFERTRVVDERLEITHIPAQALQSLRQFGGSVLGSGRNC